MSVKSPLRAGIFAKILAELRGPEAGGFGAAALSAIVLTTSIVSSTFKRTPEGTLGSGLGSIGFLLSIAYLFWTKTAWRKRHGGTSLALTEADGRALSIRAPNSLDAAMLLREVLHGRRPLPQPFGEVIGDPSNPAALRRFTPEESAASAAAISKQIQESERKFVESLALVQDVPRTATPLGIQEEGTIPGTHASHAKIPSDHSNKSPSPQSPHPQLETSLDPPSTPAAAL